MTRQTLILILSCSLGIAPISLGLRAAADHMAMETMGGTTWETSTVFTKTTK